uniref:Uncharacterized protein n=1 Tax=Calidris pygmaea TaxID=425635 RepID=A0A8C3JLL7_9CHAR
MSCGCRQGLWVQRGAVGAGRHRQGLWVQRGAVGAGRHRQGLWVQSGAVGAGRHRQGLWVQAGTNVEPPEEDEITSEVEPGLKVFSSSAWARGGPLQAQVGPEEDRDQLYHPWDNAGEADAHRPPQMLSLEVQRGPEEDRDHLYHG